MTAARFGDGNIYFRGMSSQPHKLSLAPIFTDRSYGQVRTVWDFLSAIQSPTPPHMKLAAFSKQSCPNELSLAAT